MKRKDSHVALGIASLAWGLFLVVLLLFTNNAVTSGLGTVAAVLLAVCALPAGICFFEGRRIWGSALLALSALTPIGATAISAAVLSLAVCVALRSMPSGRGAEVQQSDPSG